MGALVGMWMQVVSAGISVPQRRMLIMLSALQMPLFTQTAMGGKRMAMRPRKMSLPHMVVLVVVLK